MTPTRAGINPINRPTLPDALNLVISQLTPWGVPTNDLRYELQGNVQWVRLDPRQELYTQDEPVTEVYFIFDGGVFQERITQDADGRRRATLRRETHAGEWIGHYDLLYAQRYNASARAAGFASLVAVEASAFNRLLHRFPRLRKRIASLERINRLRTIPLLGQLDLVALSYLSEACRDEIIPAGTLLYNEQQTADHIFIIDQGQVVLRGGEFDQTWLGNGMVCGFLARSPGRVVTALPYDHQAQTTVTTALIVIPRQALSMVADINIERQGAQAIRDALAALEQVPVFEDYAPEERRILLGFMSHYFVPSQHLLMQQGEVGESLWILMPGSRAVLHALDRGQALQPTMVQGPIYFEDASLIAEGPIQSTVQAEPRSYWLHLHRDDFRTMALDHGWHLLDKVHITPSAVHEHGGDDERRRYPWLQPNENLLVFRRRHWFALAYRLFLPALLAIATLGLYSLALGNGLQGAWVGWTAAAALGVIAVMVLWQVLDYLNDYLLVTNQRLVRQEKVLFIAEHRQAAFLEQVRGIEVKTDFFGNVFDYGLITIQTAAERGTISFDFVAGASAVKQLILEQQSLRQQHYQASNRMIIQNLLEERFGLQLKLPVRVRPETPSTKAAAAPQDWVGRIRHWLDFRSIMVMNLDDRVVWRKHWILLLGAVSGPFFTLATVLLLLVGRQWLPATVLPFLLPLDLLLVAIGLGALGWLAWNITDWRNDSYEIDGRQVIDIEKKPLFFSEQRRTALLGEIENIDVIIPSPLHYLLNYGHVRLQTAAADGTFTFDSVPDPRGVAEEVRRRVEQFRYEQETRRTRQRAQELPDWFEMYDRLETGNTQLWPKSNS